jgi:hypothetical protein
VHDEEDEDLVERDSELGERGVERRRMSSVAA